MERRRSHRGDERGLILVLTALLMVGLLTIVALVVDVGNASQMKRRAQNSVDAAALAAVAVYEGTLAPANLDLARDTAIRLLSVNTFGGLTLVSSGPPTYTYSCGAGEECSVRFTFNDADLDNDGSIDSGLKPCVEVRIASLKVPGLFSPVVGTSHLSVGATAGGCRRPGAPGGVVPPFFAGGTCSSDGKAFVYSGNGNIHEGRIHSNYDVVLSGISNRFIGPRTYVGKGYEPPLDLNDPNGQWSANAWGPAAQKVGTGAWPPATGDLTVAKLGPTSTFALGLGVSTNPSSAGKFFYNLTGSEIKHDTIGTKVGNTWQIRAGVYFTNRPITFGDKVAIVAKEGRTGATFISSGGRIIVSGSNSTFSAFDAAPHRLAFYTPWDESSGDTNNCDSKTFELNGNCIHIDGLVYAPKGKISWSGEGSGQTYAPGSSCASTQAAHPAFIGAFVGWAFQFSGNLNYTRAGIPDTTSGTPPDIYLDQ